MTTDSYFWNGSFANGSYASLAVRRPDPHQLRADPVRPDRGHGVGSATPRRRPGQPRHQRQRRRSCRPETGGDGTGCRHNFDTIAGDHRRAEAGRATRSSSDETGFGVARTCRASSTSTRCPSCACRPIRSPTWRRPSELRGDATAKIERGQASSSPTAGCANCHDPNNTRHPVHRRAQARLGRRLAAAVRQHLLTDRASSTDRRIPQPHARARSRPDPSRTARSTSTSIRSTTSRRSASTPRTAWRSRIRWRRSATRPRSRSGSTLIDRINLPTRSAASCRATCAASRRSTRRRCAASGGRPTSSTTAWRASVDEAILAPGHPALRDGEHGYAVNALGEIDVHGSTSELSPEDVEALVLYLETIE